MQFLEKRPTCVTVIGWTWIILGALMALGAILAMVASVFISLQDSTPSAQMEEFKFLAVVAILQLILAVTGFISGRQFLNLKSWARKSLEILCWLVIAFLIGFVCFWEYQWIVMHYISSAGTVFTIGSVFGAFMGITVGALYLTPLVIMIRYLKSQKIKQAIASTSAGGGGAL